MPKRVIGMFQHKDQSPTQFMVGQNMASLPKLVPLVARQVMPAIVGPHMLGFASREKHASDMRLTQDEGRAPEKLLLLSTKPCNEEAIGPADQRAGKEPVRLLFLKFNLARCQLDHS